MPYDDGTAVAQAFVAPEVELRDELAELQEVRKRKIAGREAELRARDKELTAREERLSAWELELGAREAEIRLRERVLAQANERGEPPRLPSRARGSESTPAQPESDWWSKVTGRRV